MSPRHGGRPGATPGSRTILIADCQLPIDRPRASQRSRVSKTQLARGSTEAACHFHLRFTIYDLRATCEFVVIEWNNALFVNRKSSIVSSRGRGRQAMHLPCKQANAGALPADSTNFSIADCRLPIADCYGVPQLVHSAMTNPFRHRPLRGTRPKHRAEPHKLLQVGATPTPATNLKQLLRGVCVES